ncbi:MAG: pseudouridine synthase [Tepidimonas sp.]|uniref:pseudouridine synthase n=1 Tax=Tepidimonas sp. TaxID=2002775 RepID=UPI00259D7C99|nr:pseudouridine synthase [Tepidimonas sp.]MDM7456381.1 pseudouridine synthase [Tepidimonas sp.]
MSMRLNKRMAALGLCSRREADDWIARGWVRVNGQPAVLGPLVGEADREDPQTRWREDRCPRCFELAHARGLAPAGRLDIDSTGLLVLTQDGRVAKAIVGEHSAVDKEYLVRVQWAPGGRKGPGVVAQNVQAVFPAQALARLRHGLALDGVPLRPAQVEWINPAQLRFVLTEGRKRQIRRMCELVGLHVVGLKRVRIGRVTLGALPPGRWRYLGEQERF